MARVVPVGPLDAELYGFAKKEAERAERDPRYKPKNCPAERGQIVYKRIGAMVKALVIAKTFSGQVNSTNCGATFFVADRRGQTSGGFSITPSDEFRVVQDKAITILLIANEGHNDARYVDPIPEFTLSATSATATLGLAYTTNCLIVYVTPIALTYPFDWHTNLWKRFFDSVEGDYFASAVAAETTVEFYVQTFDDGSPASQLVRTLKILAGKSYIFRMPESSPSGLTEKIEFTRKFKNSPIPAQCRKNNYCLYAIVESWAYYVSTVEVTVTRTHKSIIRTILWIDGVEITLREVDRRLANIADSGQPDEWVVTGETASGIDDNVDTIVVRFDEEGVYLLEKKSGIDERAFATLANKFGVFHVRTAHDGSGQEQLTLTWYPATDTYPAAPNAEIIRSEAIYVAFAPQEPSDKQVDWSSRYAIKTTAGGGVTIIDTAERKRLDITAEVRKFFAGNASETEFTEAIQTAAWWTVSPGTRVIIDSSLRIDDAQVDFSEYVTPGGKDAAATKYIIDNFGAAP